MESIVSLDNGTVAFLPSPFRLSTCFLDRLLQRGVYVVPSILQYHEGQMRDKIFGNQLYVIESTRWKRMVSGDAPGLQNRRAASFGVADGFDSHSLPPFSFNELCGSLFVSQSETWRQNQLAVIET